MFVIYSLLFIICKRKRRTRVRPSRNLAEWTGLEPATPGVTGRYSNRLNYHSAVHEAVYTAVYIKGAMVGAEGFEPPTFAL